MPERRIAEDGSTQKLKVLPTVEEEPIVDMLADTGILSLIKLK
jgi:hypothetical protein